jgi:hypothetical protein
MFLLLGPQHCMQSYNIIIIQQNTSDLHFIYTQYCRATTYSLHSEALQVHVIFPHNIAEQQHTCSTAKPINYFINFLHHFSLLVLLFLNVPVPYSPTLTGFLTVNAVLLLDVYGNQTVIITCIFISSMIYSLSQHYLLIIPQFATESGHPFTSKNT